MASQLTGLILRLVKGSPLTDAQGDNNLTAIQNFVNGQANIVAASLNPDGTLKAAAINAISQFATLPLFSDTFALNQTLPTSSFSGGNYTVLNANVTALTAGSRVQWKADLVNTGSDTVTFTNGTVSLSPVPIVKGATTAIIAGDILAGQVVEGIFDGTRLHLMQQANVFASAADILAGTDATKVVTSAALKSAQLSYTSPLTALPAGSGSVFSLNHGLLATPKTLFVLQNQTSDLTYTTGDEVPISAFGSNGAISSYIPGFTYGANPSDVFLVTKGGITAYDKATGLTISAIDPTKWMAKCYAWL